MFLKTLTLKGFKSFADPTTLVFEPGVTVVVGPNGSGKSNVVDAVAWVLGAQGARALRGAKMDDVIFAGSGRRAALGRAEVSLTIDNSSRRLPIDFTEVTVSRTLFRTGESEYAINGSACRLLDVQELFSDTGVGRQQHVIIGQGQLDSILTARPEDRRAVIEEAAGILKYRRRRERAERRLEATEANLLRLQDLLREGRRQLKPLERQAEAARRHDEMAAELRAVRLHLAGRELLELARRREQGERARAHLSAEEARLVAELASLDEVVLAGEAFLASERTVDVRPALARVESLGERARGLAMLVAERRRSTSAALEATVDAGVVASLESEAAGLATELSRAEEAARMLGPEWEQLVATEERVAAEVRALRDEQARAAGERARRQEAAPGSPDGRGSPDGPGPAGPTPSEAASAARRTLGEERERLSRSRESSARVVERLSALDRRIDELEGDAEGAVSALAELRAAERAVRLDAERLAAEEAEAVEAEREAEARRRSAEAVHHAAAARAEALRLALDEARARAGVERLSGAAGVVGALLDVVEVDTGYEKAFEAAVDEALAAVVVDGAHNARAALEHLRSLGSGGAVLVSGGGLRSPVSPPAGVAAASEGVEALRPHVRSADAGVEGLLDELLGRAVCCGGGFEAACDLALAHPSAIVVTPDGDRLAATGWRIGGGRVGATRSALEEALAAAAEAASARSSADEAAASAALATADARSAAGAAARTADRQEAELRRQEAALAGLRQQIEAARESRLITSQEAERLQAQTEPLARAVEEGLATVAELEATETAHLVQVEQERHAVEAERQARQAIAERERAVAALRADLEVRAAGLEERRSLLGARMAEVERRLEGHLAAREEAASRRLTLERSLRALTGLGGTVAAALELLSSERQRLGAEEERQSESYRRASANLTAARQERARSEAELNSVRERGHRLEIEQAEARLREESAVAALAHDLDAEPEAAIAAPCPDLPAGVSAAARSRDLERELRLLGPINPLAVDELRALEERSSFVDAQLEDVRSARRELGRVIRAVDVEIVGKFKEAYEDVAGHFELLFSTLFPGGSGRLTLTDPENLLESGVEIEAKPAGRNVRRLSLLSGGERSLVALAYLFAVFRSRPSPFYLMDEVEAALDDVNLHRFLDLVDGFREEAQLIIVSHQKRTMEAADALYGITMQAGGGSRIVSQRVDRTA